MKSDYEIYLFDTKALEMFENDLKDFKKTLYSEEFMIFLADKCMKELNSIIDKELRTEEYETEYRDNNTYQTSKDEIVISNNSMVDLSDVSEKTLANYPDGLSLAKLIEFGTGIPGTSDEEMGWQTQVNPDRDYSKGWVYEKDGKLHWTMGKQGHFIYQQLIQIVKDHIGSWILEYSMQKLEGGK